MYPTFEEIEQLHKKYSKFDNIFQIIFEHCQIVAAIAEQLIKDKELNKDLVIAGALLHDIGTHEYIREDNTADPKEYIKHGINGYRILKAEGLPEELCRIAKFHTGTGISKEEIIIKELPLPPENYFAETIEERLIMYADKFHSKTPQFNSFATARKHLAQFGEVQAKTLDTLATEFGQPDLTKLLDTYKQSYR